MLSLNTFRLQKINAVFAFTGSSTSLRDKKMKKGPRIPVQINERGGKTNNMCSYKSLKYTPATTTTTTQNTFPSKVWRRIHNRQLPTQSGWQAAGLGLPLMIIWLLHNQALQLSRAQTLKWQQPPPPLSSFLPPWSPLERHVRWSASPLCHLTHWTPDTEPPQHWLQHTLLE